MEYFQGPKYNVLRCNSDEPVALLLLLSLPRSYLPCCSTTQLAQQAGCSTESKEYSLFMVSARQGDGQKHHPSLVLYSPCNYDSTSGSLNQMEINEYTFIYGSTINTFLKAIQDFQQDKASSDCKRRESLPEESLCWQRPLIAASGGQKQK